MRDWCIANMPWPDGSIISTPRRGVVVKSRIATPNPHGDVLNALRRRTVWCLGKCEAVVPAPRRLELQQPSEWDKFFERIFPIAPEEWRPHLLAFLRKYPVDLIDMFHLEDDSGFVTRIIRFSSSEAVACIREVAELARVIAGGGRVSAYSGCDGLGYPHLINDPAYPICLFEPLNKLLIELIPDAEQPSHYTVPVPMCLEGTLSHAFYFRSRSRMVQSAYKAFWSKAIRRCNPNEARLTIRGDDVRAHVGCDVIIPPRVAREAERELTALADALAAG